MSTIYCIGEALIDFIPLEKGKALKDVEAFMKAPGGAPANVAAAVAKFGGQASLITKLGVDGFGDFLVETLEEAGVNTDKILRTEEANTGLAFVSLREDGERDFSFYRKPSADLLLTEDEIDDSWFKSNDILHFCSVDLVDSPMKGAHLKAIKAAKERGAIISFDPNVRLPLWDSPKECRFTIQSFIPLADIVKVSHEELGFITGVSEVEASIKKLFTGDVKAVILTQASEGCSLYIRNNKYSINGFGVKVLDTTGAGDAFVGGMLFKLIEKGATQSNLEEVLEEHYEEILTFANGSGALSTTGHGAISSFPSKGEVERLMESHRK
ncbi:carbohydrate kinase family protein [Alloiococcus sp. CFN-8]|uniref:carbohydrate kinase family protein n=1 Tax=Alloiococcus sp. CFN-8 TaxID=3416081 RepID=UPI003CEB37FD